MGVSQLVRTDEREGGRMIRPQPGIYVHGDNQF